MKGQGKDDVIEVSDGYARNFLIKNKLAVGATSAMITA
ncbi:MAG: bL9 family ribosomal protein [Christensenellales bacterium]